MDSLLNFGIEYLRCNYALCIALTYAYCQHRLSIDGFIKVIPLSEAKGDDTDSEKVHFKVARVSNCLTE